MLSRETFAQHVRDALSHLYDPVYLQNHTLAKILVVTNATKHGIRAQMLREIIIEAIDQLQPDRRLPFGSKEWLAHRILNHRYLEAMSPGETADKLHISERHLFRHHHKAVEAVTAILWDSYSRATKKGTLPDGATDLQVFAGAPGEPRLADSARQMVEHSQRRRTDAGDVLRDLARILSPLVDQKDLHLQLAIPIEPLWLWIDPAVLRQIVLNTAVAMLEATYTGTICLEMHREGDQVLIDFQYHGTTGQLPLESDSGSFLIARRLVENEGGSIRFPERDSGNTAVLISLPVREATILMIDDSSDAIALFRRYLLGSDYRLVGIRNGAKGVRLAEVLKPDVIILDVMMPSQDGWQVLQSLRANSATRSTPVVVCSVLDQAELALTMGANDLIQKPVSQQALLQVCERWVHGSDSLPAST